MSQESTSKLRRMEYLGEVLNKYLLTEPKLTLKDIAEVLVSEIEDIEPFLKVYRKQKKNPT